MTAHVERSGDAGRPAPKPDDHVTAFGWVPPFAQGLVRDLRVRWALEEAGLPYRVRLIDVADQAAAELPRAPAVRAGAGLEDDGLVLFESGAIVLHIAERSEALLPRRSGERARAVTWLFAALNTIEMRGQQLAEIDLFYADEDWAKARRPEVEAACESGWRSSPPGSATASISRTASRSAT